MARRAAVWRLEGEWGYGKGRGWSLLSTPVHARTGTDSGQRLVGASRLLELPTLLLFRLSQAYTPTPVPERISRRKIPFPRANCLFCACLSPVFDPERGP